jgi:hypothetical protein
VLIRFDDREGAYVFPKKHKLEAVVMGSGFLDELDGAIKGLMVLAPYAVYWLCHHVRIVIR